VVARTYLLATFGAVVFIIGSIGRTDLPGGDFNELLSSIRAQLFTLPGDTVAYPGHGPETTIAEEIRSNPFLQ
jgi:glyoxylase-like metal-dependent hydrolase (beta-lactamase superfamily II)